MKNFRKLPDKNSLLFASMYGIKIESETKRRIDIINGYKDGLTEQIREAIKQTVDTHWNDLQEQLKENVPA